MNFNMYYEDIIQDKEINEYIKYSDKCLKNMGFTEHGFAHVKKVVNSVEYILSQLGYDEHSIELGKISGYMHDIGNCVNRHHHSHSSALMVQRLLHERGFPIEDIAKISYAVGNHDEGDGTPADPLSAALIIADKADVRRSRVRKTTISDFDIHDKVNYAISNASLIVNKEKQTITLSIFLDKEYSSVLDYFEIFLNRMMLCKKASEVLGCEFVLVVE